jgi:NTE family protein
MGADTVIAVDLNSDLLGRHLKQAAPAAAPVAPAEGQPEGSGQSSGLLRKLQGGLEAWRQQGKDTIPAAPSLLDVLASSINIMQMRITRSRMAGDPPEVLIAPRLAHLALLDFHRGREAMEAGRRAVELALPQLRDLGLGG